MESKIFYPYSWTYEEDNEEETNIRIYGITKDNGNMCLRINNFTPYVYIELPGNIKWTSEKAQLLGSKIDEKMRDKKPLKKNLVFKKKLYYANMDNDYSHYTHHEPADTPGAAGKTVTHKSMAHYVKHHAKNDAETYTSPEQHAMQG